MAYGMQQLRKAGKFLGDMDAKYAKAVQGTIKDRDSMQGGLRELTSASPLRDTMQWHGAETRNEYLQAAALNTAVGTANVASRYMLPAGGVTLAGKALYDLTTQFGGVADQQEPGQLSL